MGPKNCEICELVKSKYKCPTCLISYCSLACYKKHKETPCAKPESPPEEKVSLNDDKTCNVDEPGEVLQETQLQAIASSNEIRDIIKDKKLQKLIHNIDSSADAENELEQAMGEEAFRLFTEKILCTISPSTQDHPQL